MKIKNQKSKIKICLICLLFSFFLSAHGQQVLNDTYLHASADMLRGEYTQAGDKILSIPAGERTAAMNLTLGISFYYAGNYDEAANYFAVSDNLSSTPAAQLYAARAHAMLQQADKAVEWLQKYLSQRDKLSQSELTLDPAFTKIERSREWRTLWDREWYNAADRREAEAANLLRRNRNIEALAIIDAEITRSSTARFHALRARVYEAMGEYQPAHESAQAAIRLRNNSPEYFADAARMATLANRYDIALENINRAVRLEPYNLELYLSRAEINRLSRHFDDARNDINFYLKYLPDDTRAILQMGLTETDAGNPLAGIEYFNKLIDNDKSVPDYFIARARARMRANDYAHAGFDLAQALDLNPEMAEAWHNQGIVLQHENKLEDACYYWRRALQMGNRASADFIYRFCR